MTVFLLWILWRSFLLNSFNKLSQRHGNTTPNCIYSLRKFCISRFSQPPPSVLHGGAPFILEQSRVPSWLQFTRKISEVSTKSIIEHIWIVRNSLWNSLEFEFPTTLTRITYPSTVVKWWFFGRSRGPPEKNCHWVNLQLAMETFPFIITKAAAQSWNLRSEEVDFSRIKKYGRTQSRANKGSFR